jgi:NADPH:quinone reductase-like Zn-dependent oxidoreductase
MQYVDVDLAAPAPDEVQVRHTAIGVNYIDIYTRTGQYATLLEVGGVPGFEAAGTVIDVGSGVATVALPGGGRIKARGSAALGQKVFVRDDAIEGIAPSLTLEIIEI